MFVVLREQYLFENKNKKFLSMNIACKYLAVVGLNLVCYYQSLSGDFVFDDSVAILKNRDVYEGFTGRKSFKVGNIWVMQGASKEGNVAVVSNIVS